MSVTPLPRTMDLRKQAMHKAHFEGSLAPADLHRLRGLLAGDEGSIQAMISCDLDEEGRTVLAVDVDARVSVRCQRCLEIFQRPLVANSRLAVVRTDEQAAELPEGLEPVLAAQEIDLWAVVEDELVLAMPVYSYHEDKKCIEQLAGAEFAATVAADDEPAQKAETDGPFDILAQLKRDLDH
ncbi:MAG: YceD family protein [Chromatocurvus sp.]